MKAFTSIITAFTIVLSFFSGLTPWGRVYYADSVNGSASNSGKSMEEAFKSLDKLNNLKLRSGNGVYSPGHASFFYSPDGSELWCAYHGMKQIFLISRAKSRINSFIPKRYHYDK